MSINIRDKGANAERELATQLNLIINTQYVLRHMPIPSTPVVQRNQNQSAVGGQDLVGTFGLAIEVKRQEQLAINTWWDQCVKSAESLGQIPVLIFRQSKQKWRVITNVRVPVTDTESLWVRAELTFEQFEVWFSRLANLAIDAERRATIPAGGGETLFS